MAENRPRKVRFVEVPTFIDDKDNICPSIDRTDNAVMTENQQITAKDSPKFFPLKPPIPNTRREKNEDSFREVELTISNHIENMFLAREAKDKIAQEKFDLDRPRAKKGDDCRKKKEEKGKKKKKYKKRKSRRVLPLDDVNGQAGDNPGTGSGTCVKDKRKKEQTKTKQAKEV